jgi:hypothetical protein
MLARARGIMTKKKDMKKKLVFIYFPENFWNRKH